MCSALDTSFTRWAGIKGPVRSGSEHGWGHGTTPDSGLRSQRTNKKTACLRKDTGSVPEDVHIPERERETHEVFREADAPWGVRGVPSPTVAGDSGSHSTHLGLNLLMERVYLQPSSFKQTRVAKYAPPSLSVPSALHFSAMRIAQETIHHSDPDRDSCIAKEAGRA